MVLPEAVADTDVTCSFYMSAGSLTVEVSVEASDPVAPDYDSFAWQVLSTLATRAEAESSDGRFSVSLSMEPGEPGFGP